MTTTGAGSSKGFEEWWTERSERRNGFDIGMASEAYDAGWSACETAMNREAGWAANEAGKVERRKVAIKRVNEEIVDLGPLDEDLLNEILTQAQG